MREIRQKPESREAAVSAPHGENFQRPSCGRWRQNSKKKLLRKLNPHPLTAGRRETPIPRQTVPGNNCFLLRRIPQKRGRGLLYTVGKNCRGAVREKAVYRVKQRTGAIRGNDGKIAKFRENLSILEGFSRAVRQDITSLNAAPAAKSRRWKLQKNPFSDAENAESPAQGLSPDQDAAKRLAGKSVRAGHKEVPVSHSNMKKPIYGIREKTGKGGSRPSSVRSVSRLKRSVRVQKTAKKARQAQKAAAQAAKRTQQAARTSIKAAKLTVRAVVTAGENDDFRRSDAYRRYCCRRMGGCTHYPRDLCDWSARRFRVWDHAALDCGIPVRQAVEVLDAEFQDSIEAISDTVSP